MLLAPVRQREGSGQFAGMVAAGVLRGDMPLSTGTPSKAASCSTSGSRRSSRWSRVPEHSTSRSATPYAPRRAPRDRQINVICRSGQRAYYTTRMLLQKGFDAQSGLRRHAVPRNPRERESEDTRGGAELTGRSTKERGHGVAVVCTTEQTLLGEAARWDSAARRAAASRHPRRTCLPRPGRHRRWPRPRAGRMRWPAPWVRSPLSRATMAGYLPASRGFLHLPAGRIAANGRPGRTRGNPDERCRL